MKKSQKAHGKHIVGANSDKDLRGVQSVKLCERADKPRRRRVRIETQRAGVQLAQRFFHSRRRRIRIFVGVQLYDIRPVRLFAGRVRPDLSDILIPVFHRVIS